MRKIIRGYFWANSLKVLTLDYLLFCILEENSSVINLKLLCFSTLLVVKTFFNVIASLLQEIYGSNNLEIEDFLSCRKAGDVARQFEVSIDRYLLQQNLPYRYLSNNATEADA